MRAFSHDTQNPTEGTAISHFLFLILGLDHMFIERSDGLNCLLYSIHSSPPPSLSQAQVGEFLQYKYTDGTTPLYLTSFSLDV